MRLSKEYGLNPSVEVCFWCGKEKNSLILFGGLKGDKQAPKNTCINYDPCDECIKNFSTGILVIETSDTPTNDNQPPIYKNPDRYPTGRYVVIKEDAVKRWLEGYPDLDSILKSRKMLVSIETFTSKIEPAVKGNNP